MLEAMDHQKCMSHIAVLIDNIIKKQISFLMLFPCLKGKKKTKQPTVAGKINNYPSGTKPVPGFWNISPGTQI